MKTGKWIGMMVFLLGLLVVFRPTLQAADSSTTLTLDQAIQMGLPNDSQVRAAAMDLAKSNLALRLEIIKTYPQANLNDSLTTDLSQGGSANTLVLTVNETLPTNLNLYGQKVPTNVQAAAWDVTNSQLQLKTAKAKAVQSLISQYVNLLKSQQNLEIQELKLKNGQKSLEIAREQLKQGKLTQPAELKIENDQANAQYNLEKSKSDYQLALRQFGRQLGLKDLSGVLLKEPATPVALEELDLVKLQEQALQNRPEVAQAGISNQKAERVLAQNQNQALPDLSLSYTGVNEDQTGSLGVSYGFLSGTISGSAKINSGAGSQPDNSGNTSALTLKLTWNLDFGSSKVQIAQAQLGVENAHNSQANLLQEIQREVETAAVNYQFALEYLTNQNQALAYYQKELEIRKLQLTLGTVTSLELANAEADLAQARVFVTNAQYDLLLAQKNLEYAIGTIQILE